MSNNTINTSKSLHCTYTDEWKNSDIDLNISMFEFKTRINTIYNEYLDNIEMFKHNIDISLLNNDDDDLIYTSILEECKNKCLNNECITDDVYYLREDNDEFIERILTINGLIKSAELNKQIESFISRINPLNITTESKDVIKWIYYHQPDLFIKEIDILINIFQEIYDKRSTMTNKIFVQMMNNDKYNKLIITKLLNNYLNTLNTADIILNTKHLHPFVNRYNQYIDVIYKFIETIINYNFDKYECRYSINHDKQFDDTFIDKSINNTNINNLFNIDEFDLT